MTSKDTPEDQSEVSGLERWLEYEDNVAVYWRDADGQPHKAVGQFHGIAVPNGGGPSWVVLKNGDQEINIYLDDIAGVTKE